MQSWTTIREKTRRHLDLAFKGGSQRFEWWGKRKKREIFPKEIVLNKGFYFSKRVFFAIARDISNRLSTIEALKKGEDKYRSLTDQLPVGVYRSTPEGQLIYANPDLSKENKANYLDIVSKSGERLLDTINDIIEISKIETGEMRLSLSEVRVSELLTYYRDFFAQQTEHKGLDFRLSNRLSEDCDTIITDRFKLESIIANLIKNAIRFTSSGYIEFGCYPENNQVVFYVKDTGVGISEERLSSIFDRFVQADLSNTRPHEGSGLGLSIVKAYSEILGGRVTVASKPGTGSTFFIFLPAKQKKVS